MKVNIWLTEFFFASASTHLGLLPRNFRKTGLASLDPGGIKLPFRSISLSRWDGRTYSQQFQLKMPWPWMPAFNKSCTGSSTGQWFPSSWPCVIAGMIYFVKIGLAEVKDGFFLALGNAMTVLHLYDGFGPNPHYTKLGQELFEPYFARGGGVLRFGAWFITWPRRLELCSLRSFQYMLLRMTSPVSPSHGSMEAKF